MPGKNPGVIIPKNCDVSVRLAIQQLATKIAGLESTPAFTGLTLSGLTASRLMASGTSKELVSVPNLASWIAGAENEIDVTDDEDGTVTIGIVNPLIVAKGGTGTAALTDHGILLGSGTGAITPLGVAGDGYIPIGSAGADPILAAITGTANRITVSLGAGTIGLTTPQDTHTGASPTFAGLISTGIVRATDFAKTGWPITPGITLSFDNASKVFTVADGGSAYYYIDGVKYTLGGNKTVDLDDIGAAEGLWYIYFDGADLTASQTIWSFSDEDKALVAYLYWDATNSKEISLGYETHTFHMDGLTHARLHYAGGARWESGLLVADTGSETVNISAGDIWDEDLNISISDGAGSSLFEQVLSPAELPIYYRDGASAWRIYETTDKANAVDAGYVDGSNDLKYNKLNGTWANATVGLNNYVAYYVVATNERTEPVALIMGQRVDNKLSDAKTNNVFSGLSLTNLPFEEMVVLARLILKDTGSSVYYTLEEVLDLRAYNVKGDITSPLITQHAGLGGLDFASAGHSGFQAQGDVLDDLNTLGANSADSEFLVGTGAGALAWESGATVKTSLGLTIGTNVQAWDAGLDSLAGLTYAAASFVKMTEADTFALRTIGETADDLEATINHNNLANGGAHDYAYISGNDGATGITAAELEELSDGSETTLHSHAGGADAFTVKIDAGATAGYIGAANNDGVLRTGTSLSYTDGGDFVTINAVQDIQTSATPTFAGLIIADGGTIGQAAGPLLTFDDTNNYLEITGCKVGINVATPVTLFHISQDGVDVPLAVVGTTYDLLVSAQAALSGIKIAVASNTQGHRGRLSGSRARGTFDTPLVPLSGDTGFSFGSAIWDSTSYALTGAIDFYVDGDVSEDVAPQRISFSTSPDISGNRVERLLIKSTGNIGINEAAPESILEISHATPKLTLHCTTKADGDNTRACSLVAKGEQSGGEETELGLLSWQHWGTGDDSLASFFLKINDGTSNDPVLRIYGAGRTFLYGLLSGISQAAAGAAANELWVDTDDGNTIKLGT